ncbi:MgtC/SapB family protein [Schaedlerella sp.]|uniref:MgtC/SapB family protein n=1 Tax=Schaedlerella sp. TaxID=2676057 RepID=UPI0026602396|nr:MgtC/SapB family protein [uncultured Schaedlerella sp.]
MNFKWKQGLAGYDPFRLGAQVISGIGFLGAGTIIKEGATVKGLTTAASIWTVACIGLSVGSGLYYEAAAATVFLMIALRTLRVLEHYLVKNKNAMILEIAVANISRNMSKITSILEEKQVEVLAISTDYQDKEMVKIEFLLESGNSIPISEILSKLSGIYGVKDAKYKSAAGY